MTMNPIARHVRNLSSGFQQVDAHSRAIRYAGDVTNADLLEMFERLHSAFAMVDVHLDKLMNEYNLTGAQIRDRLLHLMYPDDRNVINLVAAYQATMAAYAAVVAARKSVLHQAPLVLDNGSNDMIRAVSVGASRTALNTALDTLIVAVDPLAK